MKKIKLAKTVALGYFVYSIITDIAIWTTAILYFINKGFQPFKNAGCEAAKNLDFSGFLARGRQQQYDDDILRWTPRQNTCKSDKCQVFFAGVAQIKSKKASLLRQCESDVQNRRVARAIIPATGSRVKSFLHVWCKLFVIAQVCATAEIIVENWSKSQKILDIATPRAAPRNSLAFFARMEGKSFDTRCCC